MRWLTGGLAGLVFLLSALVASPAFHGELHADADSPNHVCAITLAAQGYCDTTPPPMRLGGTEITGRTPDLSSAGFDWSVPHYWHAQALAPPTRGS